MCLQDVTSVGTCGLYGFLAMLREVLPQVLNRKEPGGFDTTGLERSRTCQVCPAFIRLREERVIPARIGR